MISDGSAAFEIRALSIVVTLLRDSIKELDQYEINAVKDDEEGEAAARVYAEYGRALAELEQRAVNELAKDSRTISELITQWSAMRWGE